MGQISKFHPLDKLIADDSIFLLEALVPFIEYPYKKMLVLFIKYRELTSIMNSLSDRDYISSCGFDCHPKSTEEMLASMCNILPGDISSTMKQMKQMMSMMEVMNTMPQQNKGEGNHSFTEQKRDYPNHNESRQDSSLYESILSILDNEDRGY